jgi:type IV pilus assembly protein PilV
MRQRQRRSMRRGSAAGFSLVEVLIALVVLGFGLLGYALLQTMTLRFTQSANHRTQATTLAYDLLDQMRANRFQAAWYATAGFDAGTVTGCGAPPTGTVSVANSITRWQCQVVRTLGPGASAEVGIVNDVVTVAVAWNDERWKSSGAVTADELETAFSLSTRL